MLASSSRCLPEASGAARSILRPAQAVKNRGGVHAPRIKLDIDDLTPDPRKLNILLHEIPRTALPSDVLRNLRERRIVDADFQMKWITPPPPSYPRRESLTTTYHLALPSAQLAGSIHARLKRSPYPLFRFSATTSSFRPASQSFVQWTEYGPGAWVRSLLKRERPAPAPASAGGGGGEIAGVVGRGLSGEALGGLGGDAVPVDDVWAAAARGRRVVVRGLPGMMDGLRAASLAGEDARLDAQDAVRRMPATPRSPYSTWCYTAESVSEAWRLARRLHMNYYNTDKFGQRFLMRAEVC